MNDPRQHGIEELSEQLKFLQRWAPAAGDTPSTVFDKLAEIAKLNLRIAEFMVNR